MTLPVKDGKPLSGSKFLTPDILRKDERTRCENNESLNATKDINAVSEGSA